ncbi:MULTISPECIES: DUF4179 domain-containing protein [Clostridium]|uniref:DUF4179 domain-containing protein n=3 Tax=Clostridium TaxID=1485 RepID=A0A3M0S2K8_9CLOT|nr:MULTISPECIES: DUF4179 domain-containing protein [Clostridium]ADK16469.1 putative RNA polymerase sigma factor-related protein [Clostridium ljungdahlii DSM 13528]AGY75548.1 DUF4179 domain-containing protein [Clostridium autoethanogenum DSM 10061]ALU35713.1 Hypothetical protein CLAU_1284 [Clostridium autoethanogenum DSM 10061]OAA89655.1 hypothetical protein WX45_01491 [Clostridium ljungdahlii DSM 13528]OVY52225.1 hypothetical protein WX72_01121 [Clostridium autoethanogenum]
MGTVNSDEDIIFELLNYAEIDDKFDESFELDDLTSKRIKKNLKKKLQKRKNKIKYAVTACILICLSTAAISNPTLAVNIKESLTQSIANIRGDYADYKKYTQHVSLTAYDKNIKFVINEIASDNNKIMISYSIIGDNSLKNTLNVPGGITGMLKINEKNFTFGDSIGSENQIGDKRYDGVMEIDIMKHNFPNTFYLSMNITQIAGLNGNWKFNIKVDNKDIEKETKTYNVNKNISIGNTKYRIKRICITPLSTSIEVDGDISRHSCFLFDDSGNMIISQSGSGDGSHGELYYNALTNRNTKSLTFLPFDYKEDYVPPRFYNMDKLPLELSQGELGKLIVNKLEWDNDVLKVYYSAEGKIPIEQSQKLLLLDEQTNKSIISENRYNTNINPSNQHDFIMYFKGVSKDKKYKIGTSNLEDFYKLYDASKFTIKLK